MEAVAFLPIVAEYQGLKLGFQKSWQKSQTFVLPVTAKAEYLLIIYASHADNWNIRKCSQFIMSCNKTVVSQLSSLLDKSPISVHTHPSIRIRRLVHLCCWSLAGDSETHCHLNALQPPVYDAVGTYKDTSWQTNLYNNKWAKLLSSTCVGKQSSRATKWAWKDKA